MAELKLTNNPCKYCNGEIARLNDKALQYKVLDKEHCRDLNTQERRFALQIDHHKYKRCLAMAQWCMDAECKTEKDADFLVRWEHRWLALAKEPTWAKFLQLIHKEEQ